MRLITAMLLVLVASIFSGYACASEVVQFDNHQQELDYQQLSDELRCPKCQNANLAGSDAPIAEDIKKKIAAMLKEGKSPQEIKAYLVSRYGDFISYQPPMRLSTLLLWILPVLIFALAIVCWLLNALRKHRHANDSLNSRETEQLQRILQVKDSTSGVHTHHE